MAFPKIGINIKDPGFGVTPSISKIPLLSGIAHGGTQAVNTVGSISDINLVRTVVGYGSLAEDIALALSVAGGPVYYIIHNSVQNVALAAVAMTKVGSGTPIPTLTGSPNDRYNMRVEVITGGTIGTATFRYTLDAWDSTVAPFTYSQVRPTVASFVIPGTALTMAMPAGTYIAGDYYTYTTVCQEVGSTDLGLAAAVLFALPQLDFNLWALSGQQDTAAAGATVASAFQGHLTTLTNTYRYGRGFVDVGSGDTKTNVDTSAQTWTGVRVSPSYGLVTRNSQLPFEGYSVRKTSMVSAESTRAFASVISTDMSRFASGAAEGVLAISFDSFTDQTLDTDQISTMRTWPGQPGFFIAGGKLKCTFGSNFTDLQFGRVMDVACRTVYLAELPFVSEAFRTTSTGAIDPRDANTIQDTGQQALNSNLLSPTNARGVPGHVSSVVFSVDTISNLNTTGILNTAVAMRPLGYAKDIETTLAYAINTGA